MDYYTQDGIYIDEYNENDKNNKKCEYFDIILSLIHFVYDYDINHFSKKECKEIVRDYWYSLFWNEEQINYFGTMLYNYTYKINFDLFDDMSIECYPLINIGLHNQMGQIIRVETNYESMIRINKKYTEILEKYHKKYPLYKRIYNKIIKRIKGLKN